MAVAARGRGNEGQARVCARRAAGEVVRGYFKLRRLPAGGASAYDLLQELLATSGVPEPARQAAGHLTLRVDESFGLPEGIDLVKAAQELAQCLMPDAQADPPPDITL